MHAIQSIAFLCFAVLVTACSDLVDTPVLASCHPLDQNVDALLVLKESGFAITDSTRREQFAMELLDCLGDPDPVIRDQIAYEGFFTLLRGNQLNAATVGRLRIRLIADLSAVAPDPTGFRRPFAALVLAEVARVDRIKPVFSSEDRAVLVGAASSYMRSINDHRGFDEAEGWRHAVAHTADLSMQLALNDSVGRDQLIQLRDAITTQIAPDGDHFYVYGEGERLARPILFIGARNLISVQEWAVWFEQVGAPAPFDSWGETYASQEGLAKRHNTRSFASAVYAGIGDDDSPELVPLREGALGVLRESR